MAKLSQSQGASTPARKPQKTKKLELSSLQLTAFSAILLAAPLLLQTLYTTYLSPHLVPFLGTSSPSTHNGPSHGVGPSPSLIDACRKHSYTTQIVSLNPLMIYINNFTSAAEAEALIALGSADFQDSFISKAGGGTQKVSGRTSQSAPLGMEEPLVACILDRARTFLGSMIHPDEPFSVPQLVRYFPTQRYDLHTDFWPRHQLSSDGTGRLYNRPASFFVFLRDNCTQGETWFPHVNVEEGKEAMFGGRLARGKEDEGDTKGDGGRGVRFRPVTGNAVFWVNIGEGREGKGDPKVLHAGLPVGEGEKVGMNIWPRKFFAP